MTKKSLDRKLVKKQIVERRIENKTDREIYSELSPLYYDKKTLALLITGTVTPENKKKYKLYNNLLVGLLGIAIILKLLMVFSLIVASGEALTLILVFIVPLSTAYFMYEIARYNGPVYRICWILTLTGFFQTLSRASGTDILINALFAGAVVVLSFYLDSKMFPNFSPGKLKKDSNGEYILN